MAVINILILTWYLSLNFSPGKFSPFELPLVEFEYLGMYILMTI